MQLNLYHIENYSDLIYDLFQAYYDARSNKRNTINALDYEMDFEHQLFELCTDIENRTYEPGQSICFIVNKPVKREIFAAQFKDRIVHHYIYNQIAKIFEVKFINDSYSCRKNKGIHYGIKRADHFIRSCSENYKKDAYVLKLDIKSYFMSINKNILANLVFEQLAESRKKLKAPVSILQYLLNTTIMNAPSVNCIIKGDKSDWISLPKEKSLFYAKNDQGLPIGNLTSQLFGNIYLNNLDHFIKKELKIRYYGRYVDDMILIHSDKEYLKEIIDPINEFLRKKLQLELHPNKIYLQHFSKGVKFLGVNIKPFKKDINYRTYGNFYDSLQKWGSTECRPNHITAILSCFNSYTGLFKHYKSRKKLLRIISRYSSFLKKHSIYYNQRKNKFIHEYMRSSCTT